MPNANLDVSNFDRIKITLASPEQIRAWSHGEVKKAETINYRSQKPEKDGLFCERIFGPMKDYACACGKYHNSRRWAGINCERCGVEVTESSVRRERMGHIELASPVAHVWYSHGVAKHMSTLLDLKNKDLERVLNFTSRIITSVDTVRRAEELDMLREELEESLVEFARERDDEKAAVLERRDRGLAVVLREHEVNSESALDDYQVAVWLSKTTDANALKTKKAAADKGNEDAAAELANMVARVLANYKVALEVLEGLRDFSYDLERLAQDYGVHPTLSTGDRAARIIKDADADLRDAEEEYRERCVVREAAFEKFKELKVRDIMEDDSDFREMYRQYGPQISESGRVRDAGYFTGGMGAEHIRTLLDGLDLAELRAELREDLARVKSTSGPASAAAKRITKRLSVVDALAQSDVKPSWMVMDVIPVMPPELRPMVQLDGGRYATSDLNDLYRRVINRNNRLKKLLDLGAPDLIVNNEKRILQEAVDRLFDNRRDNRQQATGPSGRALKSLSHSLNGKQGRFRQNLLGKRVDYSGRSVIVGGPELKLHQCGLPKEMARELFKPFVIKRLIDLYYETGGQKGAPNAKSAAKLVDRGRPVVWDVLEEVISNHPVLLTRAPTLHRLGIQAFEPLMVEGKAIRLHPLVCAAFNADFDGDQMAVHVPLSAEAQAEARILMLSTNNIKSPASGRALAVPAQDMVLGLFHLTTMAAGRPGEGRAFFSPDEAILAHDSRADVDLNARVAVRISYDETAREMDDAGKVVSVEYAAGQRVETTVGRIIFNRVLPEGYPFINYPLDKGKVSAIVEDIASRYSTTQTGAVLDELKRLGFHYATHAGITVSVFDARTPDAKAEILQAFEHEALAVKDEYSLGLLTRKEVHARNIEIWSRATDAVGKAMQDAFEDAADRGEANPIYTMAMSGARGNLKQIRQLSGMRGLMQSPKGDTIDRPIKTNFREGLTVLEYFISTHGARKGLADTALGTETGGYTTRRFLDFVHDAIVRTEDCGTSEGVVVDVLAAHTGKPDINLIGRVVAEAVVSAKGKELLARDAYITAESLEEIAAAGVATVVMRSALTCLEGRSVCQKCYGYDLATGKPVEVGTAVGVIAAQSIGEPGTQLTMRTFHTGGVAGSDITEGLPLVNEILESPRANRTFAPLNTVPGRANVLDVEGKSYVRIYTPDGKTMLEEHEIPADQSVRTDIEDQVLEAGEALTKSRPYGPDKLEIVGRDKMLRFIVKELQDIYRGQGVELNDKHFEIIASRMLSKVKITDSGDTDFLLDSYVDRLEYLATNDRIIAEGGQPAEAKETLIGPLQIVRASMRSLGSESFLSLASFMWTTTVLAQAALESREDNLVGLKENVIIGKIIPAGTGMKRYRNIGVSYRGADSADTKDTDVAPDLLREVLREAKDAIDAGRPQGMDGDFEMGWGGEEIADYDVSEYVGMTFDPNMPIGGAEVSLSDADRAELIGGDLGALEAMFNVAATTLDGPADEAPANAGEAILSRSLADIGVSARWANKFAEAGLNVVGDVIGKSEADVAGLPGIGATAVRELQEGLIAQGLTPLTAE